MARPADLPRYYPHGTRACYVGARCRCRACKDANVAYYHARRARELEALAELEPGPPAFERPVVHTKIDPRTGAAVVHKFKRPCPGLGRDARESDTGCPWGSYLRKDSQSVCTRCRAETVADYLVDAGRARRKLRWLSKHGVGYKAAADAASVARSACGGILNGSKRQLRLSAERRILALDVAARADASLVDASRTWSLLRELLEDGGFTKTELARRLGYRGDPPALQIGRERCLAKTAHKVEKFYRAIMAEADE